MAETLRHAVTNPEAFKATTTESSIEYLSVDGLDSWIGEQGRGVTFKPKDAQTGVTSVDALSMHSISPTSTDGTDEKLATPSTPGTSASAPSDIDPAKPSPHSVVTQQETHSEKRSNLPFRVFLVTLVIGSLVGLFVVMTAEDSSPKKQATGVGKPSTHTAPVVVGKPKPPPSNAKTTTKEETQSKKPAKAAAAESANTELVEPKKVAPSQGKTPESATQIKESTTSVKKALTKKAKTKTKRAIKRKRKRAKTQLRRKAVKRPKVSKSQPKPSKPVIKKSDSMMEEL